MRHPHQMSLRLQESSTSYSVTSCNCVSHPITCQYSSMGWLILRDFSHVTRIASPISFKLFSSNKSLIGSIRRTPYVHTYIPRAWLPLHVQLPSLYPSLAPTLPPVIWCNHVSSIVPVHVRNTQKKNVSLSLQRHVLIRVFHEPPVVFGSVE